MESENQAVPKELTNLEKLSLTLDKDAVQRTKKETTKKGYDTTGYGYQFCVNRFNEVMGENWGFNYTIIKDLSGSYSGGKGFYDVTVDVEIWVGNRENVRSCVGGHTSSIYADALKGAITNAFKKTAAFWGVGKEAYEGTIDDDDTPLPDSPSNIERTKEVIPREQIETCQFGKDKGKRWKGMEAERIAWYMNYFDKKIEEGGPYKAQQELTLAYLIELRDEQKEDSYNG